MLDRVDKYLSPLERRKKDIGPCHWQGAVLFSSSQFLEGRVSAKLNSNAGLTGVVGR